MELISSYTREQAMKDGVLIDISEQARGLFKCSVAVTDRAFETVVKKLSDFDNDSVKKLVLCSLLDVARYSKRSQLFFNVNDLRLKSIAGGGDNGELVITVMLPNED